MADTRETKDVKIVYCDDKVQFIVDGKAWWDGNFDDMDFGSWVLMLKDIGVSVTEETLPYKKMAEYEADYEALEPFDKSERKKDV